MGKKWNTQMFSDFVNSTYPDFEVRSEYVSSKDNIIIYHKKCGREFNVIARNFKTRGTCSLCNRISKSNTSEFRKKVKNLTNDEYEVIGEYVTCKDKIELSHKNCGLHYFVRPDDFINGGTRCPSCFGNNRKTTKQFKDEVFSFFSNEYIVLGKYKNNKTPLLMKHNISECNHEFMVTPDAFLRGSHCNKCGTEKRSGENHYRYNFSLTEKDRMARDMQNGEIRKWRDKVYSRDDYVCQACKRRGRKLNAHHLNSWDFYENERFKTDNGVTLCEDCHRRFHKKYGYGHNTKRQFTLFLEENKVDASII